MSWKHEFETSLRARLLWAIHDCTICTIHRKHGSKYISQNALPILSKSYWAKMIQDHLMMRHFSTIKKSISCLMSQTFDSNALLSKCTSVTVDSFGIKYRTLAALLKTCNLFWPDENSIEQCFAAHIVLGCQQYW